MRRNKRSLALITEKFHYFNRPDVAFAKRIWQSGVSVVSERQGWRGIIRMKCQKGKSVEPEFSVKED